MKVVARACVHFAHVTASLRAVGQRSMTKKPKLYATKIALSGFSRANRRAGDIQSCRATSSALFSSGAKSLVAYKCESSWTRMPVWNVLRRFERPTFGGRSTAWCSGARRGTCRLVPRRRSRWHKSFRGRFRQRAGRSRGTHRPARGFSILHVAQRQLQLPMRVAARRTLQIRRFDAGHARLSSHLARKKRPDRLRGLIPDAVAHIGNLTPL